MNSNELVTCPGYSLPSTFGSWDELQLPSSKIEVYKCIFLLAGNEGSIFQIDEETGNISMTKAADIVGPIILTVLVSYSELLFFLQVC